MDGQGKLVLTTGEVYFGQFVRGKRQGKGKLICGKVSVTTV